MHQRNHNEGDRYGRLEIKRSYVDCRNGRWYHLMKCDCGNEKNIAGGELRKGAVNSCGCLSREIKTTHGMTHTPEYKIWGAMVQRCTNKKGTGFCNYGARGIGVCSRWLSFENFIDDMGKRPYPTATLERINNDKGYSKDNCMWASRFDQSINQRIRKDNKTGYRGVSYDEKRDIYFSKIQYKKRRYFLGYFSSLAEAVAARQAAETKYYNVRN